MKKLVLVVAALGMFAGQAMATIQAENLKTVASCMTVQGKEMRITLNEDQGLFKVVYGADLDKPEYTAEKHTNDMAWSSKYDSPQKVKDVEVYFSQGDESGLFSVTDYGRVVDVKLNVQVDHTVKIDDTCEHIARLSIGDELYANMAYLDDE